MITDPYFEFSKRVQVMAYPHGMSCYGRREEGGQGTPPSYEKWRVATSTVA